MKTSRIFPAFLTATALGLAGIATYEGYRGEAYFATAAEKSRGIYTIGYGATKGVKAGDKTTPERARLRLSADAREFERAIKGCVTVPLYQHEYDAYLSLTYNIGPGKPGAKDGFCWLKRGGPSALVRKLNAGDYDGACREILRWDKQDGRVLAGLTRRRLDEYRVCVGRGA